MRRWRQQDPEGALADMQRAAELAPKWITVRYNVAQNYEETVWRGIQAKLDLTPTGYPDKKTVMAIVCTV